MMTIKRRWHQTYHRLATALRYIFYILVFCQAATYWHVFQEDDQTQTKKKSHPIS